MTASTLDTCRQVSQNIFSTGLFSESSKEQHSLCVFVLIQNKQSIQCVCVVDISEQAKFIERQNCAEIIKLTRSLCVAVESVRIQMCCLWPYFVYYSVPNATYSILLITLNVLVNLTQHSIFKVMF